ncbi:Uma2 family endonuclease [soil metagenome]
MASRSAPTAGRYSIGEYAALPPDEFYTIELSGGMLIHEPAPGGEHGRAQVRIARLLDEHAEATRAGAVLGGAGFILFSDPPTVRVPDVAVVGRARLEERPLDAGLWRGAPDLAVEINSPTNSASDSLRKVNEYLDAGVRLVWVVDPPTRTVTVYRSRDHIQLLGDDAELDGGPVLPDLRVSVRTIFS